MVTPKPKIEASGMPAWRPVTPKPSIMPQPQARPRPDSARRASGALFDLFGLGTGRGGPVPPSRFRWRLRGDCGTKPRQGLGKGGPVPASVCHHPTELVAWRVGTAAEGLVMGRRRALWFFGLRAWRGAARYKYRALARHSQPRELGTKVALTACRFLFAAPGALLKKGPAKPLTARSFPALALQALRRCSSPHVRMRCERGVNEV
eukprot:scaffold17821_cov139-Isochrysis_galbana.AAC.1